MKKNEKKNQKDANQTGAETTKNAGQEKTGASANKDTTIATETGSMDVKAHNNAKDAKQIWTAHQQDVQKTSKE